MSIVSKSVSYSPDFVWQPSWDHHPRPSPEGLLSHIQCCGCFVVQEIKLWLSNFFTDLALRARSVIELQCPSVCPSLRLSVCPFPMGHVCFLVLNLKGHKIARLGQKICSIVFFYRYPWYRCYYPHSPRGSVSPVWVCSSRRKSISCKLFGNENGTEEDILLILCEVLVVSHIMCIFMHIILSSTFSLQSQVPASHMFCSLLSCHWAVSRDEWDRQYNSPSQSYLAF